MKLAWLVQRWEDDEELTIVFEEPTARYYYKVIPIVYAEIVKNSS